MGRPKKDRQPKGRARAGTAVGPGAEHSLKATIIKRAESQKFHAVRSTTRGDVESSAGGWPVTLRRTFLGQKADFGDNEPQNFRKKGGGYRVDAQYRPSKRYVVPNVS